MFNVGYKETCVLKNYMIYDGEIKIKFSPVKSCVCVFLPGSRIVLES